MSLREHLQAIYEEHGKLTPEVVVAAARPKTSPLHHRVFDRPAKDAAAAWYHHRAHELIQSVKVVYREGEDGVEKRVRAYHAVRSEGPDQYVYEPVEKVASDPFKRQLVLRDMEREWKGLLNRYEQFEEFLSLVATDIEERVAA